MFDKVPFVNSLFMKIAEPRFIRVMQFGVYVAMIFAGYEILVDPPANFRSVVGLALTIVFGAFVSVGAVFGAIAVLPGIWWLERVAILTLTTGLSMYVVTIIALGTSPIGIAASVAVILTFCQRWSEIHGAQLAPRKA